MNNFLVLEVQRELQNLKYPTPLAIAKEIVKFTKEDKEARKEILKRISENEPWEYIRGYTFFKNCKIFVNRDVLIPRVETEKIVDITSNYIKSGDQILDIGTGSGCIAISLAKLFPKNKIFATDISKKALNIARKNIKENKCNNIKVVNANLLNFNFNAKKTTIIVSNLPYIPTKYIEELDSSVKKYEPILSLDGGEKGMGYYLELLEQIRRKNINLKSAVFEIDSRTIKYFKKKYFEIKKDCFDKKRFVILNPSLLE